MNSLIPDPQTQQLRHDCEILGAELALLFTEHEALVSDVLPNILADYQVKIGTLEYEEFSLKVEVQRLKRKIQLLQTALNHGQPPNITQITAQLEREFLEWEEHIASRLKTLEEAHELLKSKGTAEFTAECRTLYRELVRRLHPDITQRTDEREAMLLQRTMTAYRYGDVEELRALKLLLDTTGEVQLPTQTDELQKQKNLLKERIETMLLKIEEIKRGNVFQLAEKLDSPEWQMERRSELRAKIRELEVLKDNLLALADDMAPESF